MISDKEGKQILTLLESFRFDLPTRNIQINQGDILIPYQSFGAFTIRLKNFKCYRCKKKKPLIKQNTRGTPLRGDVEYYCDKCRNITPWGQNV